MKAPSFWQKKKSVLSVLLAPMGYLYARATKRRLEKNEPFRAGLKVVCVGNLAVGGTGKTPVCLALGDFFHKQGQNFFYLNHGYHSKEQNILLPKGSIYREGLSDEAFILASKAPTVIAKNRKEGALLAQKSGAKLLIMDDGFQNPSLYKDFSFLVVDGEKGFGNGRVLPAGPLREPVREGIQRAQAVILIGQDKTGVLPFLENMEKKRGQKLPVLKAEIRPDEILIRELKGKPLLAFCGIGRPEKFYNMLKKEELTVSKTISFPDHHLYKEKELSNLLSLAKQEGLILVTTRKDTVKLPLSFREKIQTMDIELVFKNEAKLKELMRDLIQ